MKIANCIVKLEGGNTVPLFSVTPAEVLLLRAMHMKNAKGEPISELKEVGELENHTTRDEMARLRTKYHKKFIKAVFSGVSPNLPSTFEDAMQTSIEDDISEFSPTTFANFTQQAAAMQEQVKKELKAA